MKNQCFPDYWLVMRALLPQRSGAKCSVQSTQLWAVAFPMNVGLWFENWIWAASVRIQMAYQDKEPQGKPCENINMKILIFSRSEFRFAVQPCCCAPSGLLSGISHGRHAVWKRSEAIPISVIVCLNPGCAGSGKELHPGFEWAKRPWGR